jgi:LPXTG-site transpeptidase (sortase) family protein
VPPAPFEEDSPAEARDTGDGEDAYPVRVLIPIIGVDADVIDLGLRKDGTLEVPSDYAQTGWYTGRSVPGEVGPSVVVGHVDSKTGPAVFYKLRDLETGDMIEIHRSDGRVALFRVDVAELVEKDDFPTDRVYGSTAEPTLRLITCGGSFDRSAGSYRGNLIVFAEHLGTVDAVESGAVAG